MLGILVGEGHFGGDGRQPQVAVRMHTRHVDLFLWLVAAVPGSKLYGPYHHGGRDYYQWMARGWALRDHLWPLLAESLVLCVAGAALGIAAAGPMVAVLGRYAARFSVRALDVTLDSTLLWVGVVLAISPCTIWPTFCSSVMPATMAASSPIFHGPNPSPISQFKSMVIAVPSKRTKRPDGALRHCCERQVACIAARTLAGV